MHNTALISVQGAERFDTIRLRPDLLGRQMESAVGAYLLNAALSNGFKLFYWRDGNHEVDFVLQHGQKVIALEVKTIAKGNQHGGISAFQKQYNAAKLLLVGNEGLSCEEFLKLDPIALF